jgi:predicted O-methyltransferase YrrM
MLGVDLTKILLLAPTQFPRAGQWKLPSPDCVQAISGHEPDHMNDRSLQPTALEAILRETVDLGFSMASESQTGSLLRTLAASKPAGRFLELGTGTGVATAWLLAGMDKASRLATVDNDPTVVAIARRYLGSDRRVTFHLDDAAAFIERQTPDSFDFVFADAWPGKFGHLEQALALVRVGGFYFVDDLLPQPNWPSGHEPTVSALIERLATHDQFVVTKLAWASGLMVLVRAR